MFTLVSRRYERASLIVTSNKAFSAWGEIFGDDIVAAAMIDRLVHHAEIIALKGDSYRLRDKDLEPRPPAPTATSTDRRAARANCCASPRPTGSASLRSPREPSPATVLDGSIFNRRNWVHLQADLTQTRLRSLLRQMVRLSRSDVPRLDATRRRDRVALSLLVRCHAADRAPQSTCVHPTPSVT